MTLGEFIQKYIEEHDDMSVSGFANMVGISRQQIGNIIRGIGNNGKPMTSTMNTYRKIAEGVGMSEQDFLNMLNDNMLVNPNDDHSAPSVADEFYNFIVIGEVAAGYNHYVVEDWTNGEIDIPASWLHGRPKEDYFVLRVAGDSMFPTYQNGDVVLVLKQTTMDRSGQIGVVIYDDDKATIKRVEYADGEDWVKLSPINPQFPPVFLKGENIAHFHVVGLPKMVIRKLD